MGQSVEAKNVALHFGKGAGHLQTAANAGADRQSADWLAIKALTPIVRFAHCEWNNLHRPKVKRSIEFVARHQVGALDGGKIRNRHEEIVRVRRVGGLMNNR